MDPITIAAVAQAAISGIQAAVEAWPLVYKTLTTGAVLDANDQKIVDVGVDAAHAALQLAKPEPLPVFVTDTSVDRSVNTAPAEVSGEANSAPAA